MKRKPITEQVVVVMGASSGIGRATALRFAERGAKVVIAARGETGLRSLASEIRSKGGEATALIADTSDFEQVKAVADHAVETYGRIDSWVHVAGIYIVSRFEDLTPEEFTHTMEVNTFGQVFGAMAALPYLKANKGGALIHVSSIEAKRAFPYKAAYACSKHAIPGFLDALRLELKHDKVPVDVVHVMPAAINTPLFDKGLTKIGVKPFAPPPVYEPEVVAEAIVRAAEHPVREIIVGAAGKAYVTGQKLMPGMMDRMLRATAFRLQRSDEEKKPESPNSFWNPMESDNRVRGNLSAISFKHSTYTWLAMRPIVKIAAAGLAGAALAFLATRRFGHR